MEVLEDEIYRLHSVGQGEGLINIVVRFGLLFMRVMLQSTDCA